MTSDHSEELGARADSSDLPLDQLIDVGIVKSLMDGAFGLTGIPAAILDLEGRVVLQTRWEEICGRFHRSHPETRAACIESDTLPARYVPPGECYGLLDGREWITFPHPRLHTEATHGCGCTLSSAIAAYLALGETLPDAVEKAIRFVHLAIRHAPGLGSGHGPLGHLEAGLEIEGRRRAE